MNYPRAGPTSVRLLVPMLAGLLLFQLVAFAADEVCATCGGQVSVAGNFIHHKDGPAMVIEGATGSNGAVFREDVNGDNFSIVIAHLAAGRYTVAIGAVETESSGPGERVFDVTSGDNVLAKNFDLFAAAGGSRKVAAIRGTIEHEDDALRGPMKISFVASKGRAKFNTVEITDSAGASVASFSASELADAFSAAAMRAPVVRDPPIWREPAHPLRARADDLIRRMSLAEKVAQLKNAAPAIARLGLPAYDYWNEALHGVANNGVATVFPEPIGAASSWNPKLFHQEGTIIGVEGRAKFAEQKGVRDPHIARGPDGAFYLGMTDLHVNGQRAGFRATQWERPEPEYGWGNNRALVLMKSWDLIHWTHSDFRLDRAFPEFAEVGCIWAPETIYDEHAGKMMIYFTMKIRRGIDSLYFAYTDDAFTKMETKPELLFKFPDPEGPLTEDVRNRHHVIDGDITQVGDKFHLFYSSKENGTPGIEHSISDKIHQGYPVVPTRVDPEKISCEAPNVFRRLGTDTYVLMYDAYGAGNMGFSETTDFVAFKDLGRFNAGVMKGTNFDRPKHGAVLAITRDELRAVAAHWKTDLKVD